MGSEQERDVALGSFAFLHKVVLAAILSSALSACVALPREDFTQAEQAAATPVGFEHVRWAEDDPALGASLRAALKPAPDGALNILALSGGGANAAFGAGVITEWTRKGDRPQFQLVTGVSAGAMSAPLAFLGPAWDAQLSGVYQSGKLQHLLEMRIPGGLFTPGFYRKGPLKRLVASYVTDALLAAITEEQKKGRRLLVATTNLDTEQLVVWDMGAIASKGGEQARKLFAEVLVASASVPLVFPPSLITVQGVGRTFREMHVDGQTESAFFSIPQSLILASDLGASALRVNLYVIVDGSLDSNFAVTPRSAAPILSRVRAASDTASIRSLLIADAEFCRQNGCKLYVTSLPQSVKDAPLDFSAAHLQSLLSAGKDTIDSMRPWRTPPDWP
jgi:predicted acylesterase/phospholipase RssA